MSDRCLDMELAVLFGGGGSCGICSEIIVGG